MFRSTRRFACAESSSRGIADVRLVTGPDASNLRGWYRLKIRMENHNIQKVVLSAADRSNVTPFETVCGQNQFRCYVFVSDSVQRLDIAVHKLRDLPDRGIVEFRPISLIEFIWKWLGKRRAGRWSSFIRYFIDPRDNFLVTFEFPKPHLPNEKYESWIANVEPGLISSHREQAAVSVLDERPDVTVLLTVCDPQPRYLKAAIESVLKQTSPRWKLSIADDASTNPDIRSLLSHFATSDQRIHLSPRQQRGGIAAATNEAFRKVQSPFVACLDHDDTLADMAIEAIGDHFASNPTCNILFSDEDKIDERGNRFNPYFKPRRFSPELFFSYNYINHLTVHRSEVVRSLGGWRSEFDGAQDYDLTLRALKTLSLDSVHHLAMVLYHWRAIAGSAALDVSYKSYAIEKGRRALESYFAGESSVSISIVANTMYRLSRRLPADPPGVSVLVPFRDRPELLATCVESVLKRTDYENLELVLIDNGSVEKPTLELLAELRADPRVRTISDDGPFNYAYLNNCGARAATKPFLCLLNNDIEVTDPGWLREMMSYAIREEIGCVGAKLYYPGGSIQHAGVVLGIGGVAGHAFLNKRANDPGYFGRLFVTSNYSALTGACLLVRRDRYFQVGGLDQDNLKIAFNDIDFCLKIQALGLRNVFTPFAELVHNESASRGGENTPEKMIRFSKEFAMMRERYGALLTRDPWYSPHLSLERSDFSMR